MSAFLFARAPWAADSFAPLAREHVTVTHLVRTW